MTRATRADVDAAYSWGQRALAEVQRERDALRAKVEQLQASFDAHHLPNVQEDYRCDVCGEDHPHVSSREHVLADCSMPTTCSVHMKA